MYLCGALKLTDPQKRLLEQRGVVTIDLSPLLAGAAPAAGRSRHALALEWLLLSLKSGEVTNPLRWPTSLRRSISQPAHLPALIASRPDDIPETPLFPQHTGALTHQVPKLLEAWQRTRQAYPGWVVTPHENREQLWEGTRHWVNALLKHSQTLQPEVRLAVLFELNWRLERVLVPLFLDWVQVIEEALAAIDLERLPVGANWPYLEEAWVSLAFAVAREAREDFDAERHDRWMARLLPIAGRRPEWTARWHYENCLHSLWRLDQREVRSRVEQWRPSPDLVVWQMRRASILAEIGDSAEAERTASDGLRRIRTGLRGRRQFIELLSLEGWAMRLLGSLRRGERLSSSDEEWERFRDRWLQLTSSRCDPWRETEALHLPLRGPHPPLTPPEEKKQDFDYGVSFVQHIATDNLTPILPAFALLRLYEEVGLPMRAASVSFAGDEIENACRWIMPFAPLWAVATLVRAGRKEPLRDAFDRVRIATLNAPQIETLRNWLMAAIRVAVDFLPPQPARRGTSFSEHVTEELVDLLSRLCIRMSPQQLEEAFQLAVQLHKHPGVRSHLSLHDVCRPFFRRVFGAATGEQICSWVPELLAVPTLSAEDARQSPLGSHLWPDPFEELDPEFLKGHCRATLVSDENATRRIEELLHDAAHQKDETRQRAIHRLWVLEAGGLLTEQQRAAFGRALWAQVSVETGLPEGTRFFAHAFLDLPAPDYAASVRAVRERLLKCPTLRWFSESVQPDGKKSWQMQQFGRTNPIITDVLAATRRIGGSPIEGSVIDWTADEARLLLKKAIEWWDADKRGLEVGHEGTEWRSIERLLNELDAVGIATLGCIPAMLIAWPDRAALTADRIRAALQQGSESAVVAAAEAAQCWTLLSPGSAAPKLPSDVLDELCNRLAFRQQPALDIVMVHLARIVREAQDVLNAKQLAAISLGLEHLLLETQLPGPDGRVTNISSSSQIPLSERPLYRARSAWLAYEVSRLLQKRSLQLPPVFERWKLALQQA
jgi:hypothetical protein